MNSDNTPLIAIGSRPSRRSVLRGFAGLAGAFSLAGVLQACGDGDSGPVASGGDIQNAKFQLRWVKDVAFAGYFAAVEKGYYSDEGLDVEIVAGGPNIDVQRVVAGGGAEIGGGITDAIIRGRAQQDIPLRVFGALYQTPPSSFITFAESGIRGPADFIGKRVATSAEGVVLVKAMMTKNGLDPDGFEFVPSGFDPSPLLEGAADIYQGFSTDQGLRLQMMGRDVHVVTYPEMGYNMYDGPLMALDDTLEQQEDLVVGFLRATIKGWEYNAENPDEISEITIDKYGVEGLERDFQIAQNQEQLPLTVSDLTEEKGLFWMTEERWQETIDFLTDAGQLEGDISAADVMTTDILTKAYGGKTRLLG